MSEISLNQAKKLLSAVAAARPDGITCDECFTLMAALADSELQGTSPLATLQAAKVHFTQCACCAYEYETLLESLRASDESASPG